MNDDVLRIYAGWRVLGVGPRRPPRATTASGYAGSRSGAPELTRESMIVEQLREVIERPSAYGESVNEGFVRKEHELSALFRALAAPIARALLSRLADPLAGDPAADAFARLAAARRRRLLAVLEQTTHGHVAIGPGGMP
jgi:hypothetical protein